MQKLSMMQLSFEQYFFKCWYQSSNVCQSLQWPTIYFFEILIPKILEWLVFQVVPWWFYSICHDVRHKGFSNVAISYSSVSLSNMFPFSFLFAYSSHQVLCMSLFLVQVHCKGWYSNNCVILTQEYNMWTLDEIECPGRNASHAV